MKRFVFQTAVCMTAAVINKADVFVEAINFGIAYDLPNDTSVFREYKKLLPMPLMRRRHRRDLYNKMEVLMEA